ncbi:hypothetical protein IMG5_061620 [Ichthyophthirius multifiliis]|uniref:Transmembrane protein n=1 Tax=Ichthyophthirius multifiliis TaxID=5932 RepID=G0QNV2_ICHMU|nr:hypothetical protein IMG5_061620 [Ichthyophthirius multifiliis]EGR33106.1 hypothetical protein IMG5_061620 [Ichthyophthirius multifiliis]|eukprot:XP_004037092.1 hypothetical protein IMG5_061620 [Ichthyophthirius multifiliis]
MEDTIQKVKNYYLFYEINIINQYYRFKPLYVTQKQKKDYKNIQYTQQKEKIKKVFLIFREDSVIFIIQENNQLQDGLHVIFHLFLLKRLQEIWIIPLLKIEEINQKYLYKKLLKLCIYGNQMNFKFSLGNYFIIIIYMYLQKIEIHKLIQRKLLNNYKLKEIMKLLKNIKIASNTQVVKKQIVFQNLKLTLLILILKKLILCQKTIKTLQKIYKQVEIVKEKILLVSQAFQCRNMKRIVQQNMLVMIKNYCLVSKVINNYKITFNKQKIYNQKINLNYFMK